jgi:transposase
VSKTFRPYSPGQAFLLPPSPLEWLPEDHLARFVMDVVGKLDLGAIYRRYEGDLRGYPPYHPQMMVSLLLYGYCVGVPSSRKIERKTHEDVAFRVIAGGGHPDHSSVSEFRRVHLAALADLFVQVLRLCQAAGMVKLGHVSLDGTKVKANASKHKAMSYDRMQKDEQRFKEKVAELMKAAERADREEDAAHGKNKRGDELPEDLRRAKDRLARIEELKAALEAEALKQHEAAKAAEDDDRDPPPPGATRLPSHQVPRTKEGTPEPKAQRNFTDAESRIMKGGDGGFVQAYNCQAAVDAEHQIIVAEAVTNQPPDVEHLVPMVERVVRNCEAIPAKWSADAGYFSEANVCEILKWKIDPYIATGRRKHDEPAPSVRGRPPANLTIKQQMARKLATKRGAAVYARRKVIPEPVFGQIKEARGFRRFLLRGLAKVRHEWSLIALTHNLLKLHRAAA